MMIEEVRAVVTEVDDAGVSKFRSANVVEPVLVRTPVGDGTKERTATLWQIWGTSDGVPGFQDKAEPVIEPYFPPPGATRFAVFTLPPDSSVTDVAARDSEASGDHLGIADAHEEGGDTTFHATSSIDYIFVAEGEVVLELDEGKREVLTRGSCLVQRGTMHAWRNESTEPVVLVWVGVGVIGGLTDNDQRSESKTLEDVH
jgi:mannose-6-phosphate isomerase-like protein (cupin superfamily)